jgi:hypothetical protein
VKAIIICLLLIQFSIVASCAGPFLVCDEYTNPPPRNVCLPDTFLVQFDSGPWIPTPAQVMQNTGNTRLYYDLSGVPAGLHTVKAKARCTRQNLESGESAHFSFKK